ncbi:MAG: hypothetical protein ACFFDK_14760 [Promethearchaeota archaeon]
MRMPDLLEKVGPFIVLIGVILSFFLFVFFLIWSSEISSGYYLIISLFYLTLGILAAIFGIFLDLKGKKYGNILPIILGSYMLYVTISNLIAHGHVSFRWGMNIEFFLITTLLCVIGGCIINLIIFFYRRRMTK